MLIKVLGVILFLFFYLVIIYNYRKNDDLFCPLCVFSLFQFLKYVPSFLANKEYEHFVFISESMAIKLFFVEVIFCISVFVGWSLKIRTTKKSKLDKYANISSSTRVSLFFIYAVYLLGLASRVYIISKSGGLSYILSNTSTAYLGLSNGFGYISILSNLMIIGILMLLEYISKEESKTRKKILTITLIAWFVIAASSSLVFSSRTQTMVMIITLAFGYNYFIKKIRLNMFFKPKNLIVILSIFLVIVFFPMFRTGKIESVSIGYIFERFFDEFSYYGRDSFVYNHFSYDNFWLGKSFLNILKAPIPSSFLSSKPPIDDGIYLTHLLNGIEISPNTGRDVFLYKFSIPFSSQSSLYANFGIVGVVIGGIFTGQLLRNSYSYITKVSSGTVVMRYYVFVYLFGFTTYNIVHTIIILAIIEFVWQSSLLFRKLSKREYEKNTHIIDQDNTI